MEQTDIVIKNRISGGYRGFVTIATGDYYCQLAINLVISYRVFSSQQYPFCVITSKDFVNKLSPYFDRVIVVDNLTCSFLDKIYIYDNSPFCETIFIDADSNVTEDISYAFDLFSSNGSDVSAIGRMFDVTPQDHGHILTNETISCFQLKKGMEFNGGVYYLKRSDASDKLIRSIFDDIIPNYTKYGLKLLGNGKEDDESVFCLAMLQNNMRTVDDHRKLMRGQYDFKTLTIDKKNNKCSFCDYGQRISPSIMHWMTCYTHTLKYVTFNSLIRSKYQQFGKLKTDWYLVKDSICFWISDYLRTWFS